MVCYIYWPILFKDAVKNDGKAVCKYEISEFIIWNFGIVF